VTRPLFEKTLKRPRPLAAAAVFALSGLAALGFALADGGFSARSWSLVAGIVFGVALQRGELSLVRAWRDLFVLRNADQLLGFLSALFVAATLTLGTLALIDAIGAPKEARIGPVSWMLPIGAFVFGVGSTIARGGVMVNLRRLAEGSLVAAPGLLAIFFGFVGGVATWPWIYRNAIVSAPRPWLPDWFGFSGALVLQIALLAALAVPLWRLRSAPSSPLLGFRERLVVQPWPATAAGALLGTLVAVSYAVGEPLGLIAECATVARSVATALGLAPESLPELDAGVGGLKAPLLRGFAISGPLVIVVGFLTGAFASALGSGRFSFAAFTMRESVEMTLGGLLLGWGAMTALGAITGEAIAGVAIGAVSGWVFFGFASLGVIAALKLDRRAEVVLSDAGPA
jgi:hypothetical protein